MKKVIYIIALLIGVTTMAQTITVNGTPMLVSDDISFPFWLESGSSISPEVPVSSISVLEFNIVPNNNGNDMVFNQVISVTEGQTVPEGKTWKVESILMENQEFVVDSSNTSLDSAFVASMIADALSSIGNNSSYQPSFSLECVDAGISPMCGSLGLDPNYSLISSDNYFFDISFNNQMNGNYISIPHWRKFKISGLNLNDGEQIMFLHKTNNTCSGCSSSENDRTYINPLIENEEVFFYIYATNNNGSYAESECITSNHLGLLIPLSNSINTIIRNGGSSSTWDNILSHFEIFYLDGGTYKSTGIIFDCN